MKLIYIHQYFTFPQSAGGTRSYDLAKSFIKRGIDVTMVTTSAYIKNYDYSNKKRWTYVEQEGIKFWILKCPYNQKMSIPNRVLSFFRFMWFASIKVVKIKADIVLTTSTPLTTSVPAMIKKFASKTPYIFEVRDVWPEGPIQLGYVKNRIIILFLRWLERFIYYHSAFLVVLSIGMKKNIISRINKLPRIEVIPNISEISRFSDVSNTTELPFDLSNKKVILYAGTLGPVNRIIYVAELAKKLCDTGQTDIIFLIVGDGNEKTKIIDYCKEHNILNLNIFFIDIIPKNALPYLYSISTMGSSFVLDKKIKWDNSANKFFDTLAAGRPILINHKGWQAELIEKEDCGYVLPSQLNDNEVNNFISYIHNDKLLIEQGKNARKIATEQFSLDVAVDKFIEVFSNIIKK